MNVSLNLEYDLNFLKNMSNVMMSFFCQILFKFMINYLVTKFQIKIANKYNYNTTLQCNFFHRFI
jgi:hypothetical protein